MINDEKCQIFHVFIITILYLFLFLIFSSHPTTIKTITEVTKRKSTIPSKSSFQTTMSPAFAPPNLLKPTSNQNCVDLHSPSTWLVTCRTLFARCVLWTTTLSIRRTRTCFHFVCIPHNQWYLRRTYARCSLACFVRRSPMQVFVFRSCSLTVMHIQN